MLKSNRVNHFEKRELIEINMLFRAHDIEAWEKAADCGELIRSLWQAGTGAVSTQVFG